MITIRKWSYNALYSSIGISVIGVSVNMVGVEDHRFCGWMGRLWVIGTDGMNGGWYYQTDET